MRLSEFAERAGFSLSLRSPQFFRRVVRPELYRRCRRWGKTDPEDVHKLALEMANRYVEVLEANKELFDFPNLTVRIKNIDMQPFGTAAGMDKNGDGLIPFSHVYGFMKFGTVPLDLRSGNGRPRIAVDDTNEDLYNTQGFPSNGLGYARRKLRTYRTSGAPQKPVIASVCGLPYLIKESGINSFVPDKNRRIVGGTRGVAVYKEFQDIDDQEKALENAYEDTRILIDALNDYADGFEWNIFSPNTATLPVMRTPENFKAYAKLVRSIAGDKLSLAKMGPYTQDKRDEHLRLAEAWLEGGGDGVTNVNTLIVPKDQVPSSEWKYPSAGKSGNALKDYRMRAITDTRAAFPKAIIFAAGGIYTAQDCLDSFYAGANATEDYTPSTFYGFGLQGQKKKEVSRYIGRAGYDTLQEFMDDLE